MGPLQAVLVGPTRAVLTIGGQLVKTHPRKTRGKQTDFGDYPPEKIAFHMRTPAWCRRQAKDIGPACEQVIAELLADNALYRLRAAQGVIGLADRHDPSRLEAACAKAIAAGDPSYRTIKGILATGAKPASPRISGGRRRRRVLARARLVRQRHPPARDHHQQRRHRRRGGDLMTGPAPRPGQAASTLAAQADALLSAAAFMSRPA